MALSKEIIEEIKRLRSEGIPVKDICKKFDIVKSTVVNINLNRTLIKIDKNNEELIFNQIEELRQLNYTNNEICCKLNISLSQLHRLRKRSEFERPNVNLRLNNIKATIRYKVSNDWLILFSNDIEKLKTLNMLTKRLDLTDETYKQCIEFFWNDDKFNKLYQNYLESDKDTLLKPSLDHIITKSAGGSDDLNNLQVTTWFENRARNDIPIEKWNEIKQNINKYIL